MTQSQLIALISKYPQGLTTQAGGGPHQKQAHRFTSERALRLREDIEDSGITISAVKYGAVAAESKWSGVVNEYEKAIMSRGDDFRLRIEKAAEFIGRLPDDGVRSADHRKMLALYKELLVVVEKHERAAQLMKAMESV